MNDGDWGPLSGPGTRTELQIDFALSEAEILFAGDIKTPPYIRAMLLMLLILCENAALHY